MPRQEVVLQHWACLLYTESPQRSGGSWRPLEESCRAGDVRQSHGTNKMETAATYIFSFQRSNLIPLYNKLRSSISNITACNILNCFNLSLTPTFPFISQQIILKLYLKFSKKNYNKNGFWSFFQIYLIFLQRMDKSQFTIPA